MSRKVHVAGVGMLPFAKPGASDPYPLLGARQAVASGEAECVLALGFEQMKPGALGVHYTDRPDPSQRLLDAMDAAPGTAAQVPIAAQLFGGAGRMHMQLYGTRADTFARIAVKARQHAQNNPNAIFRQPLT